MAIAKAIVGAAGMDALLAPHIPYGVTGSMAPYPGALHIPEDAFRAYLEHPRHPGRARRAQRDGIHPGDRSLVAAARAVHTLYQPGEGWPTDFDLAKAQRYRRAVIARVEELVRTTIANWKRAGF